jgi:mevalonate kinase
MLSDFTTTTHGKWILTGEHAVIRGHRALVFPVINKKLTLTYHSSPSNLSADYAGECGSDLHLLFWSVLEHGMHVLGRSLNTLNGHFFLESNIPIGVGMGASAALCVATARWFHSQGFIQQSNLQSFATSLENLFHGKSSGLDIAGVAAENGIEFQQGISTALNQTWQPNWYLSSCGQIGITSHCINQVNTLWEKNHELGERIDEQMKESVRLARQALEHDTPERQVLLAHAINLANHCFEQWGLISENLHQHLHLLKQKGAIAVKPTGSGGGGFVISLWNQTPPAELELIRV